MDKTKFEWQEGANVRNAISVEKLHGPFILAVGNHLILIADQDPYMPIGNNTTYAIAAQMAMYYVFNFGYPDVVHPTLLFLQSFYMEKPDDETEKCSSLEHTYRYMQHWVYICTYFDLQYLQQTEMIFVKAAFMVNTLIQYEGFSITDCN